MSKVSIFQTVQRAYPAAAPFHPPEDYPEYPFKDSGQIDLSNAVYAAIRQTWLQMGLDHARAGQPDWNPLGEIVTPGDRVLIKPNLVRHFHGRGLSTDCLIAHGSVIRAVVDYVLIALQNRGEIIIGDAPLQSGQFELIVQRNGLDQVVEFIRARTTIPVRLVDFRAERATKDSKGRIAERIRLDGDPLGYTAVNTDSASFLTPVQDRYQRFRVTNYDPAQMTRHHNLHTHEYLIANSLLTADVVINIPKLKTHKKTGITAAMKNMVGINGSKDWLPHHTVGSARQQGDEYAHSDWRKRANSYLLDVQEGTSNRLLAKFVYGLRRGLGVFYRLQPMHDKFSEGSWYGNNTIWRTVLDLNRIMLYADAAGQLQRTRQRQYLALIDAIIAGDGDGPTSPNPRPVGLIVGGREPAHIDRVCAALMGFEPSAVSTVRHGLDSGLFGEPDEGAIDLVSNVDEWDTLAHLAEHHLGFAPPAGWRGHVEYTPSGAPDVVGQSAVRVG